MGYRSRLQAQEAHRGYARRADFHGSAAEWCRAERVVKEQIEASQRSIEESTDPIIERLREALRRG